MNIDAMNRRGGAGGGVLVVVVVAVLALVGALVWTVGSTPAGAEAEAVVPAGVDEARSIEAALEATGIRGHRVADDEVDDCREH